MFKNRKDWAIAMANGREFSDNDGWVYKFDESGEFKHSPFRVLRHGTWEEIRRYWCCFDEVKEIFGNMPNLEVDTNVLVKDKLGKEWSTRHFMKWDGQRMVCFANGDSSFTEKDKGGRHWNYYKVVGGAHKGKSNVTKEIFTGKEIENV